MYHIGIVAFIATYLLTSIPYAYTKATWELGPFQRVDKANPILTPRAESVFFCPMEKKEIHWEIDHTFNPAALVRNGKVYLLYRAEDNSGSGLGYHTSRLGLGESADGIHFNRNSKPVFFPRNDDQQKNEFPGGCEDPRIVETASGDYVMMYTQWNRQVALLAVATSKDLIHWKKHGFAFEGKGNREWSKSASVVCRCEGDHLIATKIQGKYWMYWGEGSIYAAQSNDLISWEPLRNPDGSLLAVLQTRPGKFDSGIVEAGPPAVLTKHGIVLLYNGKNGFEQRDASILPGAYSAGQALFDSSSPTKLIARCEKCFLKPERPYEIKGQYQGGTVFIEGLVSFKNKWFLYYGTADSAIGVACSAK